MYDLKPRQNKKGQTFVEIYRFFNRFFWILISCLLQQNDSKTVHQTIKFGPSYIERALAFWNQNNSTYSLFLFVQFEKPMEYK